MLVKYGPKAAWLARATAHELLYGNYQPYVLSGYVLADAARFLDAGMSHSQLRRYAAYVFNPVTTNVPLVLDYMPVEDGEELDGIGLTVAAIQWLVDQRFIPAIYVPLLDPETFDHELIDDPEYLFWREHIYIAPPEACPFKPRPIGKGTVHNKKKTYTSDERIDAHRLIDAREDLESGSKAAHKAHVTRRTRNSGTETRP